MLLETCMFPHPSMVPGTEPERRAERKPFNKYLLSPLYVLDAGDSVVNKFGKNYSF